MPLPNHGSRQNGGGKGIFRKFTGFPAIFTSFFGIYADTCAAFNTLSCFCRFSVYKHFSLTQKPVQKRQGMAGEGFSQYSVQTAAFVVFPGYKFHQVIDSIWGFTFFQVSATFYQGNL
jgi:hypothetical protein